MGVAYKHYLAYGGSSVPKGYSDLAISPAVIERSRGLDLILKGGGELIIKFHKYLDIGAFNDCLNFIGRDAWNNLPIDN